MKKITLNGSCIWVSEVTKPNEITVFKKKITIESVQHDVKLYIAVETKYFLYINGQVVVMDGGLFRESMPGCGYVDEVDITSFLKIGENLFEILVDYYGNAGRNNVDSGRAGLWVDCPVLGISSDQSFLCTIHRGYYTPNDDPPAYLFGGDHVGFDARLERGKFKAATLVNAKRWGDMYLRSIPLHRFSEKVMYKNLQHEDGVYSINLPHAMAFFPVIQVEADGGEKVVIYTDRYIVNGGPGDHVNSYRCHKLEYICKKGLNKFTSTRYLYGEKVKIMLDSTVKNLNIGYIETGYDTDIVGYFYSGNSFLDALVKKSARTLYVCMRDNLMDCPDRERGQWIGDASVQVPQVFFLLGKPAQKLVRKCIMDFINLRKGDVLVGNVPGVNFCELPAQSLCAISQWGLIAQYVKYSGDDSVLEAVFDPIISYLKLWDMGDDGLVAPRNGDWRWFDHLQNVDDKVLENAWYYSALRFSKEVGERLACDKHTTFINERLSSIKENFNMKFWKSGCDYYNTSYYSSGKVVDDRANAMAVLSGLCDETKYSQIRTILLSVFNASIYMENFILIALCEMGYVSDAYRRMSSRFHNLAINENSTLWEDFYILGTKNHAWGGVPATLAFRYFMGIDTNDGFKTMTINPCTELFPDGCRVGFYGDKGMIQLSLDEGVIRHDNVKSHSN